MPAKWRGIGRARRIMRRLPDSMRNEIEEVLNDAGPVIQGIMRSRAPVRRGAVREGIVWRVLKGSMRLRIGLLGTKSARSKLFYGRIQDLGRRAQTVFVQRRRSGSPMFLRRGRKWSEDIVTSYRMNVRAMAPKRFVTGRMPDARQALRDKLHGVWDRALRTISGASND